MSASIVPKRQVCGSCKNKAQKAPTERPTHSGSTRVHVEGTYSRS